MTADTTGAPGLETVFSDQAVDGTIVIADERSGEMLAYDVENVHGSSAGIDFKVPHALFALDAGAVRDEFQVIRVGWRKGTLTVGIRSTYAHPPGTRRYGVSAVCP